jgi:hypothetical protein
MCDLAVTPSGPRNPPTPILNAWEPECYARELMFHGALSPPHNVVIRCKGCGESVPAPVETLAASWIAANVPCAGSIGATCRTRSFEGGQTVHHRR